MTEIEALGSVDKLKEPSVFMDLLMITGYILTRSNIAWHRTVKLRKEYRSIYNLPFLDKTAEVQHEEDVKKRHGDYYKTYYFKKERN